MSAEMCESQCSSILAVSLLALRTAGTHACMRFPGVPERSSLSASGQLSMSVMTWWKICSISLMRIWSRMPEGGLFLSLRRLSSTWPSTRGQIASVLDHLRRKSLLM